jgi:hypothetical protein
MAKQNNGHTLRKTVMQKEFWVGLITTFIVLLVAFKLIPWNNLQQLTTNKTDNVVTRIPTGESIGASGASTATSSAPLNQTTATNEGTMSMNRSNSAMKKVSTLADTSGNNYIVQNGDNYYTISVKVCGNGKYFESIQADNSYASLYAGDQLIVNCAE